MREGGDAEGGWGGGEGGTRLFFFSLPPEESRSARRSCPQPLAKRCMLESLRCEAEALRLRAAELSDNFQTRGQMATVREYFYFYFRIHVH